MGLALTLASLLTTISRPVELKFIWQAEVNSEQAKIYAEVSRDNAVVMVVSKGDFLNVVLEVSVLADRWCRVALPLAVTKRNAKFPVKHWRDSLGANSQLFLLLL
jgi:hypothetical protein